jgi:UDP:flavonoid glycosyltransferase YjiC (YdhE family)
MSNDPGHQTAEAARVVVFFCMPGGGHFQRLRPLVSGICASGHRAYVFTDLEFREQLESAGATFVDLFAGHTLDDADDSSLPKPCRFVTFAGLYADEIASAAEALRPCVIVHDSFAVIGRVVATILGLPRVAVCAGHAVVPDRFVAMLERDPDVRISADCLRAVGNLRRHGIEDASPFSYVSSLSSDLNVYCEPPEFLDAESRGAFEPVEFFGSLPATDELERGTVDPPFGADADDDLKIYVSFGTVVRRSYTTEAVDVLTALAEAFAEMPQVRAIVSLGGMDAGDAMPRLRKENVSVSSTSINGASCRRPICSSHITESTRRTKRSFTGFRWCRIPSSGISPH